MKILEIIAKIIHKMRKLPIPCISNICMVPNERIAATAAERTPGFGVGVNMIIMI